MQDVSNSIGIYTSNCMIVTTAARYLAPYATVELALILINSGQVEEAGLLLETAKYGHLGLMMTMSSAMKKSGRGHKLQLDCIPGQVTKTTVCRADCILGSMQLKTSFER